MPTPLLSEEDRAEVLRLFTEMKSKYGSLDAALAAGKPTGEIKTAIDKVTGDLVAMQDKYQKLAERADAIEEKQRQKPAAPEPPKSIGQQFIDDPNVVRFLKEGGRGQVSVILKGSIWMQAKDITGVSQAWPQQLLVVAAPAYPPIGVRTLIPPGRTTAGAVEYIRETSFTNAAAPVNEAAAKPQSEKTFVVVSNVVRTIAHWFKVSKQTADDLPFLMAQIENNGIYGVQKAEDNQLLNGTNVAPQLEGLLLNAVAAPAPPATTPPEPPNTLVDAIGMAVFDLASKGYMADGTVVNPVDWGNVAMLKNTQGNYLFANPVDYQPNVRLWGTRVVQTSSMATSNFLVGAFRGYSQLLDREDISVQIANQNQDDFIKNLYTVLVEERVVLVIYVPAAFEKGVTPVAAI